MLEVYHKLTRLLRLISPVKSGARLFSGRAAKIFGVSTAERLYIIFIIKQHTIERPRKRAKVDRTTASATRAWTDNTCIIYIRPHVNVSAKSEIATNHATDAWSDCANTVSHSRCILFAVATIADRAWWNGFVSRGTCAECQIASSNCRVFLGYYSQTAEPWR